MKKILLLLLCTFSAFSQHYGKIAQKIKGFEDKKVRFEQESIFSKLSDFNDFSLKNNIADATIAALNLENINKLIAENKSYIELEIPYNGKKITVLLYKIEIHTEDFQIDSDKQKNIAFEKGLFYRGIVKNDYNSLASFNFFKNQMSAIISDSEFGNLVIGKLEAPENINNYIIYEDSKLKIPYNFKCATVEEDLKIESNSVQSVNSNRCATIYFEMDYSLFLANGSSSTQSAVWMNSVYNNVQTLFNNDGISTAMKSLFIWTSPDPYTGTSSLQNLNTFRTVRPVFNGDIGQLVGIDGGFGGLARAVNGLCNIYNYSYSDLDFAFQSIPLYSWTVNVISHELGHLLGSPHTHGCFWNGNNTAIDGCGPTVNAIYAEGTCPTAPLPTTVQKGTIMSYCFLIPSIGINFANGFGPQPSARMIQNINNSICLSTDCINTCISQISNLNLSNSTNTTATISFTDANSSNQQWQYSVASHPFANNVWTNISTNSFVIPNLASNTYYKICVRPICPQGVIVVPNCIFITTNADFCAGQPFTDTGGLNNNYQDDENWIRTIVPIGLNNKLKVVFSNVNIELNYDFLYVFDGLSTSNTNLTPSGITGSSIPGPFQSTAASGALTFKFLSDGNTVASGWNASFNCVNLGIGNNDFIDFSYFPNPVKNNIEINSKNEIQNITIYTIEGKLIYSDNKKFFKNTISMLDFAKGTYLFKLTFENKPIMFKVIKE